MRIKEVGMIIGGTILLGGLGYGGYLAYKKWVSPEEPKAVPLITNWKIEVERIVTEYVDSVCSTDVHGEIAKLRERVSPEEQEDMAAYALAVLVKNWGKPLDEVELTDADTIRVQLSEPGAKLGALYDELTNLEATMSGEGFTVQEVANATSRATEVRAEISRLLTPKLDGNVVDLTAHKRNGTD